MSNVNVINKSKEKINVEVNENNGNIQIIIDVPPVGKELSLFAPGEVFEKNGVKYIVCEHFEGGGTAVVRKECLEDGIEFGDTNNWAESNIRKFLNGEYLKNISDKTLSANLKELEADRLIVRTEYPQIPPKVEYSLSDLGKSLMVVLDQLCIWGEENRPRK